MKLAYRALAGRIRTEIPELGQVAERALRIWQERGSANTDYYVDAVALNLHGFYAGLERLLEVIADEVDETKPGGAQWHLQLLRQMTADIPQVRPAVVSLSLRDQLNQYRGFRHVVRNVYSFHLDSEQIEVLMRHLPAVADQIASELLAFADFLEQAAE